MPSWPKGDRLSPCDGGFMPPLRTCCSRRLRRALVFSAIASAPTCADPNGAEPRSAVPIDKRNLRWITGHKISAGATTTALPREHGDPGDKSPSTRGGQPLELWYCAFDGAGPTSPRSWRSVTPGEQNGEPGRVVELLWRRPVCELV